MTWNGELGIDKIIYDEYFKGKIGIMVEVGAANPIYLSMSTGFKEMGWRIIAVEPNPKFVQLQKNENREIYEYALSNEIADNVSFFIRNHNNDNIDEEMSYSSLGMKYENVATNEIKVKVRTLNWLLESLGINKIDLLAIDTEGWELEVMQGFDTKKYEPLIIVLENINRKDEYDSYMKSINYDLKHRVAVNSIYKIEEK
jgi:FkbM family methyltransferase